MRNCLILLSLLLLGCSKKDIKRQVYFNFKMGTTISEFENEATRFYEQNGNKMYTSHSYNRGSYYSSLHAGHNKYDSIINRLTLYFFINPEEYKGQYDANRGGYKLLLDAESKEEIIAISNDILNDLKSKYGEPDDTTEHVDFEIKQDITKEFIWSNKNDLKITFSKNTIFYENYENPSASKYFYGLKITYDYTEKIKNKYFKSKSPY